MILDAFLEFDPKTTSVAIAAGTQASTNIIDLHGTNVIPTLTANKGARDIGIGDDPAMKICVQVDTAFASSTSTGTINCAAQGAQDNGSGLPGAYSTYITGPTYTIPGVGIRLLDVDWPRSVDGVMPRFIRLLYTVAVQTMTAGTVNAHLVLDRMDQIEQSAGVMGGYPAGITVAN